MKTCTVCEQRSPALHKGKHVPLEDCVRALARSLEKVQRDLAEAQRDARANRGAANAALYVANLGR